MRVGSLLALSLTLVGCAAPTPPGGSYYEERIAPLFEASCQRAIGPCHVATERGTALGNLDLSSYDSLMRRRDLLPAYGPYPVGMLFLKVGEPVDVAVDVLDPPDPARPDVRTLRVTTDIRHTAGSGVEFGSEGYRLLVAWARSGYDRNGVDITRSIEATGGCSDGIGQASGFDPAVDPADRGSFDRFVSDVQPVLRDRCSAAGCHGARLADLYLSCGDTDEERRWNYFIAVEFLAAPVERSELLRRPLAASGSYHTGGEVFSTAGDAGYQAIHRWAEELVARDPSVVAEDDVTPGYRFFANRVQPLLVRKGCTSLNCHSPISVAMHLRGGSGGSFSRFARRRNYAELRRRLAIESPDPNQSRIVAKNLFPPEMLAGGVGIVHRGGSLLEDDLLAAPTPEACAGIDADAGDLSSVPAYCVIARWHAIERADAIARGEVLDETVRSVVYVARPPGVGAPDDFDTYRPGADLRSAAATVAADGGVSLSAPRSLLGGCGLDPATTDVRGVAVSWDAERIAFGARAAADRPLRLYRMAGDGSACELLPGVAAPIEQENGILTHDFHPAFAPDGRIVFASTRGDLAGEHPGPRRAPASMRPNANLYVWTEGAPVRQLTFLLDQELYPAFMFDGRVIYTTEKRAPGFHQLALRRQNLDGGDYHPLYASRGSLGFDAALEVRELPNQNLVFTASALGAPDGAGIIAIGNRSIGPDQDDRDPGDRGYLHGMRTMPAGVFRSPAPLPTGRLVVSCAAPPAAAPLDFDLCELDPSTGITRPLLGEAGVAEIEAVAVYRRVDRGVLRSDGIGIDHPTIAPDATDAVVHFNDFPMIASLMFENTREGRPLDLRIRGFDVVEALPPPAGAVDFDDVGANVTTDSLGRFYVERRVLGHVPVFADGSTKMRLPGGVPVLFQLTDGDGTMLPFPDGSPFTGEMFQREFEQYYPGERIQRSIPRRFFNAACGACHGSISGRELDVAVDPDIVSGASLNEARDAAPFDIMP